MKPASAVVALLTVGLWAFLWIQAGSDPARVAARPPQPAAQDARGALATPLAAPRVPPATLWPDAGPPQARVHHGLRAPSEPSPDPTERLAQIQGLLKREATLAGVELSDGLFEATRDEDLRERIALLLVQEARDPGAAARFLADHAGELAEAGEVLAAMARRADAGRALYAQHARLCAEDADARARGALVRAMGHAEPELLLAIARRDPDARVQAHALAQAAEGFRRGGEPERVREAALGLERLASAGSLPARQSAEAERLLASLGN
jgi:hypothetical protein